VLIIDKLLNMMGSYRQQIRDQEDYESKILQSEHQYKLKFEELEKEITIMKKGYEERINKLQRIIKNNRDIIELYRAELESQEARGEGIEGIITSEVSKDGVIKTLITNIGAKKSALIENRLEK
jgi:predicted RNase H-like nuclease (RuvC/YqgF family)